MLIEKQYNFLEIAKMFEELAFRSHNFERSVFRFLDTVKEFNSFAEIQNRSEIRINIESLENKWHIESSKVHWEYYVRYRQMIGTTRDNELNGFEWVNPISINYLVADDERERYFEKESLQNGFIIIYCMLLDLIEEAQTILDIENSFLSGKILNDELLKFFSHDIEEIVFMKGLLTSRGDKNVFENFIEQANQIKKYIQNMLAIGVYDVINISPDLLEKQFAHYKLAKRIEDFSYDCHHFERAINRLLLIVNEFNNFLEVKSLKRYALNASEISNWKKTYKEELNKKYYNFYSGLSTNIIDTDLDDFSWHKPISIAYLSRELDFKKEGYLNGLTLENSAILISCLAYDLCNQATQLYEFEKDFISGQYFNMHTQGMKNFISFIMNYDMTYAFKENDNAFLSALSILDETILQPLGPIIEKEEIQ